jgi:hypothetical protein
MFANAIHVKMLNGFRQGVSDGSEDHDHDDTEITNNVALNTAKEGITPQQKQSIADNTQAITNNTQAIATVNDYWEWESKPTSWGDSGKGPSGKIRVQSNKHRLWHSGSEIWKKNNTGGDVVLPNGFYKCVVTTLANHEGHQWTTDLSFALFRGIFDYVTTSSDATNDDQPCYTVDVTQTYHKNSIGSSAVDNTGRAEIVFRPNDDNFEGGENDDAIKKLETYIRWKDAPETTTTDFVRLRFRMFPILIGE